MKESVLTYIKEVVSSGITDKDDFFKYRLPQLETMADDKFVISFSSSASHLFSFNEETKRKDLELESERFRFMQHPEDDLESFLRFTRWEGYKSIWRDGEVIPADVVLFYDGTDIKELTDAEKKEFPDMARKMWKAVSGPLQNWVSREWVEELKYYKQHIPVVFSSPKVRQPFLLELRSENGRELMRTCKHLQRWWRHAVNQKIYIGLDLYPHCFSFCECVNGKHNINGGIIYDEDSKTWSIHT